MAPTARWYSSACAETLTYLNHHLAPAVCCPTGRSGYLAVVLVGALLFGIVSAGLYFSNASAPGKLLIWQLSLIGIAWLAAALGVFQFLRQLPVGTLEFDGGVWYFADKVGSVKVRFDGQNCLLLRFEDDVNKTDWLWLEARFGARQDPNDWLDLRRAVYSRATVQNLSNLI